MIARLPKVKNSSACFQRFGSMFLLLASFLLLSSSGVRLAESGYINLQECMMGKGGS